MNEIAVIGTLGIVIDSRDASVLDVQDEGGSAGGGSGAGCRCQEDYRCGNGEANAYCGLQHLEFHSSKESQMERMPCDECANLGVDKVGSREKYRFITGVRRAGTRISRRRSTVRHAQSRFARF